VKREVDSRGRGKSGNPEEGERLPLEAATKQRLVKTEELICAVVTVCNSVRLS
jgi:hypothetical protein